MGGRSIRLTIAGLVLAGVTTSAATAAPTYTPLACTVGPVHGKDHTVVLRNTTGHALKAETIINYELD